MTSDAPVQSAAPYCTPAAAAGWLRRWRAIGGGVTIATDGVVCPWRWLGDGSAKSAAAVDLLHIFLGTTGMADAVRERLSADIHGKSAT